MTKLVIDEIGGQCPVETIQELTESLTPRMVAVRHWHDASFINLPMVYPSGSFVTVRVRQTQYGVEVSDAGFAYQEADMLGAGRSFGRTAKPIAESFNVQVGSRIVFVDVTSAEVERAVFDVSAASHRIANKIVSRALVADEAREEVAETMCLDEDEAAPDVDAA